VRIKDDMTHIQQNFIVPKYSSFFYMCLCKVYYFYIHVILLWFCVLMVHFLKCLCLNLG